MLWILLIALIALGLVYFFVVRPVLKNSPMFSAAFAEEASMIEKVQAKITGWKTIIAARLVTIGGLVVGLYDQALPYITGQDWTPLTAKIPAWTLPLGLVTIGVVFEWLRKVTANPPAVVVQKVEDTGAPVVVAVQQPPKA